MECRENDKNVGIELEVSGIEAHSSIEQGERYHHQRIELFNVINTIQTNRDVNSKQLRISIKSMNETRGPNALVTLLLVFST